MPAVASGRSAHDSLSSLRCASRKSSFSTTSVTSPIPRSNTALSSNERRLHLAVAVARREVPRDALEAGIARPLGGQEVARATRCSELGHAAQSSGRPRGGAVVARSRTVGPRRTLPRAGGSLSSCRCSLHGRHEHKVDRKGLDPGIWLPVHPRPDPIRAQPPPGAVRRGAFARSLGHLTAGLVLRSAHGHSTRPAKGRIASLDSTTEVYPALWWRISRLVMLWTLMPPPDARTAGSRARIEHEPSTNRPASSRPMPHETSARPRTSRTVISGTKQAGSGQIALYSR